MSCSGEVPGTMSVQMMSKILFLIGWNSSLLSSANEMERATRSRIFPVRRSADQKPWS